MAGTPNVGTLVGAAIRPINTADLISTAYANEIKGGIHGYATILERDSIIIQRRQWGMLCTVYDDPNPLNNKTYQLKYNNFDTDLMNLLNWVEYTGVSTTSVTEWQNSVKSILTTVPTSPSDKDRYLVGIDQSSTIFGSPWAGNPGGFISEYDATTTNWTNTYPTNGMTIRVDDQDNSLYKYEGTYSTGKWDKEKLTQVYSTDFTGNGINYTTTTTPGFISYDIDTIFLSKFDVTNTGTIVKLDINGIGLLDVKKPSINGLVDLYPGEIQPDNIYSLVYDQDNNCFQFFKNYSSDSINIKYYIEPTDYIVVPPFCQYWIYGDLTVDGTIVNYGKIIVANGQLIIGTSGSVENFGEVDLITIGSGNTVDFSAIDGHLIPSTGDTYDIGATAGYNWRDLYLSGNTIHLGDSIISSSNGDVLFNGNTVSTTQSLQSITDNGNTTSNEINANGGIQGSTDYSSYAIGTSYYNDMKQVSLQVYGDGTDFPVNSGCRLNMNPEEGFYIQRFDYSNSTQVSIYATTNNLVSQVTDGINNNELSINTTDTTSIKKIVSNEGIIGLTNFSQYNLGQLQEGYDSLREFYFLVKGDTTNYSDNVGYEFRMNMDNGISLSSYDNDNNNSSYFYLNSTYGVIQVDQNSLAVEPSQTISSRKIVSSEGIFGQNSIGNNFGILTEWNDIPALREVYFNIKGDGPNYPTSDNFSLRLSNQQGLVATSYINNGNNQANIYMRGDFVMQAIGTNNILSNLELNSSSGVLINTSRIGISSSMRRTQFSIEPTLLSIKYLVGTASVGPVTNILSHTASGTNNVYLPTSSGTLALLSDVSVKYKVYTAILIQTDINAPTPIILENTLGDITWSRATNGQYLATSDGLFTIDKTFPIISGIGTDVLNTVEFSNPLGSNVIGIITKSSFVGSTYVQDGSFYRMFIEIRVYN